MDALTISLELAAIKEQTRRLALWSLIAHAVAAVVFLAAATQPRTEAADDYVITEITWLDPAPEPEPVVIARTETPAEPEPVVVQARPEPVMPRVSLSLTRKKRSKMCGRFSRAMPMPVSETRTVPRPAEAWVETTTRPLSGVYLMALPTMLSSAPRMWS